MSPMLGGLGAQTNKAAFPTCVTYVPRVVWRSKMMMMNESEEVMQGICQADSKRNVKYEVLASLEQSRAHPFEDSATL